MSIVASSGWASGFGAGTACLDPPPLTPLQGPLRRPRNQRTPDGVEGTAGHLFERFGSTKIGEVSANG